MLLTILGCGSSPGVPYIQCRCPVCRSKNPKNQRLRCSAWIRWDDKSILIDTSTDLRQQALKAKIPHLDAVLFTHPHADHVHGIDELRSFNFIQKSIIPVYGNEWTCAELRAKFDYIFRSVSTQPREQHQGPITNEGGGIPNLGLNQIDSQASFLEIAGKKIIPISLQHGSQECVGYRFDSLAYVTDCSYIPPASIERMQGLSVLILDCLRLAPHGTHLNLDQALDIVTQIKPKRTFLTHLSHEFDYPKWVKRLPKGVSFAYDGLIIKA